jgi:hypothetical protein
VQDKADLATYTLKNAVTSDVVTRGAEAPEVFLGGGGQDRFQVGGGELQNSDLLIRVSFGAQDRYRFPVVVDDEERAQLAQRFGMNAVGCGTSPAVAADEESGTGG